MRLGQIIQRRLGALAGQEGFGIVEVLVAAVVLMIGVLAIFSAFDAGNAATFRASQTQVALDKAQQEMEQLRLWGYSASGYNALALTYLPTATPTDPGNPDYRISSDTFNLNKTGTANYADLVVKGDYPLGSQNPITSGVVDPGPTPFTSGDVSGMIYRFVVWQKNNGCPTSNPPTCPYGQDFKRVIIVVKPNTTASGGSRPYVELQSNFIDPQDSSISDVPPNGADTPSTQSFWLTDVPCASSGTTTHTPPSGNHLLHNTLGTCASGPHTGTTAGAPDALLTSAPSGSSDPTDTINYPPIYDYSTDSPSPPLEPATNPLNDKGVQILPQDVSGCNFAGTGTNPQSKIHRWVTNQIPSGGYSIANTSPNATLVLYSKTINGVANQPGKICVWLFKRSTSNTDTQLLSVPATFATGNWPTSFASPIKLSFSIPAQTVPSNYRLGLAISVDVTTPAMLEFMYDHPSYQARLEVQTTTPASAP
jgi:type II secretory pathway pseudopilin PulG